MRFPDNSIGISDILQWRDCPTRMEFGMRRHTQGDPPESWSPQNAYGSAVHVALHELDDGATEQEAVAAAVEAFPAWIGPAEMANLYEDIETYLSRDELGVRTIVAEEDLRVPLFEHEGETIYFRFRLDRLYQRLDDASKFIAVDYKTSSWAKSQDEVDEDLQLWAYNFGIHEHFPECEDLIQNYDQLNFGLLTTRKSEAQREKMKEWLIANVKLMLDDDDMEPSFNQWCPWCPLKFDCDVVRNELTDFAKARIAALMPREPKLKKDGSPSKTLLPWEPDPHNFDEYVSLLDEVATARKTLEAFEKGVKDVMQELPTPRLHELGYELGHRSRTVFSPMGMRALWEQLGPELLYIATLSQAGVERFYHGEPDKIAAVMAHAEKGKGYTVVQKRRS